VCVENEFAQFKLAMQAFVCKQVEILDEASGGAHSLRALEMQDALAGFRAEQTRQVL
jgi:hypothetical protein